MAARTPDRQQQLRRRHTHERQAVVFGSILAGMALATLGAAAVYTDALDLPLLDREFSTKAAEPTAAAPPPAPCPPADALPVPYAEIQVRVLNGAGTSGLAGSVATELSGRGFGVSGADNYPTTLGSVAQIHFGAAGTAAAYTVAAQLDGEVLVLDQREDAGVDLVLGEAYTTLLDPATIVLDPATPLTGVEGCVPLEEALAEADPAPATGEDAEADQPAPEDQPAQEQPAEG